jgi:hypothetical protein
MSEEKKIKKNIKIVGEINWNTRHAEVLVEGYAVGEKVKFPIEPFTEFEYSGNATQVVAF